MKKTSFLVLFSLLLRRAHWTMGTANDNAAGFAALCNLYELAGQGAKLKEPVVEDAISPSAEGVGKLATTLGANDSVYREFKAREPEWAEKHPRPRDDGIRQRYAVGLELDLQKLNDLKEKAKLIRKGFTTAIEGIKGNFSKARFGGDSKTDVANNDPQAFGDLTTYATACGGTGGGVGPGKSLANDILCLCTSGGSGAAESELCAKGISGVQTSWTNTLGSAKTNLGNIVKKCVKANADPSPESVEAALAGFRNTLGSGTGMSSFSTGQDWEKYVLGKGGNIHSAGCSGTSSTANVCVNYYHPIQNGGIPWETALRDAVGLMRQLDGYQGELVQMNRIASHITHEANKAFAEALHMDNLSKKQRSNPEKPEPSTKEPTAVDKKEGLSLQTQRGYTASYKVLLFGMLLFH